MKRRIVVIVVPAVLAAVLAALLVFSTRNRPPRAVLPTPNGYDDFAAAAQWIVAWRGAVIALPPKGIRNVVKQNSKVLELVHNGLKKESMVPVTNDMNWLNTHMVQVAAHKSMAQLLVAEGLIRLAEEQTNEAARSFADCIVFARAAHRRGFMIDELVGIACQAIGSRQLVQVAPHVSPDALHGILDDLIALDQAHESVAAIVQRDRQWSRGTYGWVRSFWATFVMHKSIRGAEVSFETKYNHSVAALRLLMTDLAVRLYEREHGKLPLALADLVPARLPAVPVDPFSHRPLVYRVTTSSFLLYSVGPDGRDDQGAPIQRGEAKKGDLLPTSL